MNAEAEAKGEALRAEGDKPYVIPGGGSNRVGALGYVSCAQELVQQADEMGLRIDRLVTATGSAGTHAGLLVGLEGCNAGIPVLGIGVRNPEGPARGDRAHAGGGDRRLCRGPRRHPARGGGGELRLCRPRLRPARPQGMVEAVACWRGWKAILLDPVYSGKAMAGLIDLIRKGAFRKDERVVFLHTGGAVGLFGYTGFFEQAMRCKGRGQLIGRCPTSRVEAYVQWAMAV